MRISDWSSDVCASDLFLPSRIEGSGVLVDEEEGIRGTHVRVLQRLRCRDFADSRLHVVFRRIVAVRDQTRLDGGRLTATARTLVAGVPVHHLLPEMSLLQLRSEEPHV